MKLVTAVRLFPDAAGDAALREHADVDAAKNIAARGALGWADAMQPHAV